MRPFINLKLISIDTMTEMENLETRFDELSKNIPEYESNICSAIDSLEQASFFAVEKGKEKLEYANSRLNEVDELISTALSMFPLSEKANARLMQCLVSVRPRLNSYVEQLKSLIENPPTEPKYPILDDVELFKRMTEDENENNNANDQNDNNASIVDNDNSASDINHENNNKDDEINDINKNNDENSESNHEESATENENTKNNE